MKKITILIAILFAVIFGQAQITANFTWTGAQCSGGTLVFTDASTVGQSIQWLWEVSDGTVNQASPPFSHTFPPVSVPTDFQVSLYVTQGGTGLNSNITKTVTIYPLPAVAISPTNPTICEGSSVLLTASGGDTYDWGTFGTGATITPTVFVPTTFMVTGTDLHGCINTASTDVSVYLIDTTVVNDEFCETMIYDFYGATLNAAGTYYHALTSLITGCDSVIQLNLVANPLYFFSETYSICAGESYLWQGLTITETGIYTDTLISIHGCDSIRELILTVNPLYFFSETHSICAGESYLWQGTDYTETGIYTVPYLTVHGCDSIYELELTVHLTYEFVTDESVCAGDSLQWRGQWYSLANTYTENHISSTGCDSTYVLNLTVNPLPELVTIIPMPNNGILPTGTMGSLSLSTSYTGTNYWTTKGAAMFSGNIAGTGSSLNLGSNYISGSYDVWSETTLGCKKKQGIVVFTEDNGTGKIIATPTYGNSQNSFTDGSVKMRVYQITQDINNNDVIIPVGQPKFTSNGNAEFSGLAGNYYLKSEVVDIVTYETVIPIFFYDGPTVDSANVLPVPAGTILPVNINHPEYPDTTGSNTIGGSVDSLGGAKVNGGIPDQIVILRNEITGQVLSVAITDSNGEYFIAKAPDNTDVQLYVTSFEYQNWTAANLQTAASTNYTVNFLVDGNSVYPEGLTSVNKIERLEFNIYPNPTTDLIHLENIPDGSLLQVFDLQGKLVVSDSRSHKSNLDVSALLSGQYIIVISHNGSLGTQKFIKQ